jgi:hypothetical protein
MAPAPRGPAIVLTHDVDSNFERYFAVSESLALLRRDLRERRLSTVRRALGLARRILRPRDDSNDCFDEWAALASFARTRPTYFVASYGLFDAGSKRHDVPYDIRHPRVASTLRNLVADGAEIGVHFSLQAAASADQIRLERDRLEEVVRVPIRSARHHWWAVGNPPESVLGWHATAGIEVDCSLGFNDRPGFRRGIAAPFRPFDRTNGRALPIWEMPTAVMDLAIFDGTTNRAEGIASMTRMLETTASVGGLLVLDWHAHALNPRVLNGSGGALVEFLSTDLAHRARRLTPLEAAAEYTAQN